MTNATPRGSSGPQDPIEAVIAEIEGDRPEPPHPFSRRTLDNEEREIKDALLRMGSLIVERIRETVEALEAHDANRALAVIEGDAEINAMQEHALGLIVAAIATQAPVARDLRFLMTLDHISYELERIGDSAANVAKRVRDLAPEPPLDGHVGLAAMGYLCADVLGDAVRALVEGNPADARTVAQRDDEIDAYYHAATRRLAILAQQDPGNVERAMKLAIAAHYLERIGDRVTNIAEDVVYLATGQHEDLNP